MTTKTKHLNLSVIFYNKKYLEKKTLHLLKRREYFAKTNIYILKRSRVKTKS